ncbi:MAG: hypothetical protein JXR41_09965 [Bacteroidales bacterium]|nr:hypothetical protein [Bacteroidales bacterium]MBN2763406.1 hypothetical protein [Bacteroidales bacterium]
MKTAGRLLHVVFSAFLIWQSILLIERLSVDPPHAFKSVLVDSLFINLFITGIFTIVYSFPLYRILPETYYKIKRPDTLKLLCNFMQIEIYRKILRLTLWRKDQNKKYYFDGTRNGFNRFIVYTKRAEFGHGFGFIIVLIINIYLGLSTNLLMTVLVFVINILFNFYPYVLQRYHRLRLNRIIK